MGKFKTTMMSAWRRIKPALNSRLFWLQICALGIWLNYFYPINTPSETQRVYVVNDSFDAEIVGGPVEVKGDVGVSGHVDVNLEAINGNHNCFWGHRPNGPYYALPVTLDW